MQITDIQIEKIKPYSRNAKKHTNRQIQQVADSIKEFGWGQPIVVDKNSVVIVGHARLEAAKLLGLTEVPTLQVDLDKKRADAYRLADNKLNESDWDMELVIEELKALEDDALVALTGFEKDLLIEPDERDDVIPENAPTRAKLGDIWQLGRHRVMCGDSTQQEAVLRLMEGKKADMVFTDPPYGMNLKPKKNYASRKRRVKSEEYEPIIGDQEEFDMTKVFEAIDCPIWYVWGADYLYRTIPNFREGSITVWSKRMSEAENSVFGSAFELLWTYPRRKKEIWFVRGINQSNERVGAHPTQKPTELGVRGIMRNTKEGDVIYDAFLGSGSTLIASEKTGRICYGMELDEHYVDVVLKRYEDYTGDKAVKL